MIKTVIHAGDIHIRNLRRQEEYQERLSAFIEECKRIVSEHNSPEEVRIVITGDILHSKLDISSEGYILASWFLRQLDKIATTYVIGGNHDVNLSNLNRLDPLSAIFGMCDFERVHYLDKELGYQSGCLVDDNVVWCLYSQFDDFAIPNITETKLEYPKNVYIGLFHGEMKGSKTDTGYASEKGLNASYFEDVDMALLGHIHKRQCLKYNGIPMVYSGSLIQQDFGENISGHGYVLWNVENQIYKEINLPESNYGFATFAVNSIEDIDEDKEIVLNL